LPIRFPAASSFGSLSAAASRCWRSSIRDRSPLLACPGTPRKATSVLPTVNSRKNDAINTPVVPTPAMYAREAFRVSPSFPSPCYGTFGCFGEEIEQKTSARVRMILV
jgi:hypothetical protein